MLPRLSRACYDPLYVFTISSYDLALFVFASLFVVQYSLDRLDFCCSTLSICIIASLARLVA